MPLSANDLAAIRDEIGASTPPSDQDLNDDYARLGSTAAVILAVLERRRADLLTAPASVSVPGEISVSNVANITTIDEQLKRLRSGGNQVGVTRLVRPFRRFR